MWNILGGKAWGLQAFILNVWHCWFFNSIFILVVHYDAGIVDWMRGAESTNNGWGLVCNDYNKELMICNNKDFTMTKKLWWLPHLFCGLSIWLRVGYGGMYESWSLKINIHNYRADEDDNDQPNLFHGLKVWAESTVAAKDLLVNNGGNRQAAIFLISFTLSLFNFQN